MVNQPQPDWVLLFDAIVTWGDHLGLNKSQLSEAIDISDKTLQRMGEGLGLQRNVAPKMRSIEKGLGWPHGTAERILAGEPPPEYEPPPVSVEAGQAVAELAVGSDLPPDDEYWIAAKSGANLSKEDRQLIVDMVRRLRARQAD